MRMGGGIVSAANLWVNSTGCSGELHFVLKHFEDPKNHILNILKEKFAISDNPD